MNDRPASDDNSLVSIPHRIVSHDLGVGCDILWRQLRELVRLRVNPTKRLQFLQFIEIWLTNLLTDKGPQQQTYLLKDKDPVTNLTKPTGPQFYVFIPNESKNRWK